MIRKEDSGFYQMKCETNYIAQQYDACNCSIALILAIIRILSGFKKNTLSKFWVCKEENKCRGIIPSSIIESTSYSTIETRYLRDIRNEIYNLLDTMALFLQQQYLETELGILFKAQMASGAYKQEQRDKHLPIVALADFVVGNKENL